MSTAATDLGPGGTDANGKPIFVATDHTKFAPSVDRELSDQEQLAWKSFQLWRSTMSIERRDSVYRDIATSDYTNFHLSYHIMGTPYPVIDNVPGFLDCVRGIRLYEHGFSMAVAFAYGKWIESKASTRVSKMQPTTRSAIVFMTFLCTELCCCYRSMFRLSGYLPNDYECRKYGVLEDPQRLEKKKQLWQRYAAYKQEWCRRFDYHVYGIRPGENWSLLSACWFPSWRPRFGTITNYPPRKNPYFLTATPMRDIFAENPFFSEIQRERNVPLIRERPEMQYMYHGPINASKTTGASSSSA